MVRIDDLLAYVGTTAAISGAVAISMVAAPSEAPQPGLTAEAPVARRVIGYRPTPMPEEYRRELAAGIAACFDAANPPSQAMMDEVNGLYAFVPRYEIGGRWSTTASGSTGGLGDGCTLLWSFAPDGLSIPSGVGEAVANNELFARMDSLFAARGGRATWVQQFVRCFQRWESVSGVNYVRVTVGGNDWDDGASWNSSGAVGLRGDVRISMKNIDGTNGVLAYNGFPGGGSGGNMVIDRSESWASGSTGNTPFRFLRNTVMHEHGHGLGFSHVCPIDNNKLMEPFLNTNFDGPQQDELRAVQRNYGDPYEPNNSAAQAVDLGALGVSGGFVIGATPTTIAGDTIIYPTVSGGSVLSIDANGETDWFKFTPGANTLATITVTPVGSTYDEGPQTQACDTGTSNNALARADLTIRIIAANGTTTLALENDTLVGVAETLPSMLFSAGQVYHVVVGENDAPTESQLYRLTITANGGTAVSASDSASPNSIAVNWTNVAGASQYQIFRATTDNFASATQIGTSATNTYTDGSLPNGATFFYWVKATQTFGGFTNNQFVGGPDQGSTSTPANNPPTANAGPDQNVRDPQGDGVQAVTLNGSGSSDSDGTIVSYVWTEAGSQIATGVSPVVNLSAGSHTIQLTVTDDDGSPSSDTVTINVVSNLAPTANAGADQTVTDTDNSGSELIQLNGSASSDTDGSIVSYVWTEGGSQIATGASPTVTLAVGLHNLTLTVTDNEGRTGTDLVDILIEEGAPTCAADFNGDGFLDFFDYDDFVSCYETGNCPPGKTADYNGDEFVDFFDYDDFVGAFEAGC